MEENNNTPDKHHNHKRATAQKKKTPRQRKYRLAGTHIDALHKRTRIQRRWKNTCKLKEECRFLHFLAHSKNIAESKKFLCQLLSKHQYTVLRELVINNLASNLPTMAALRRRPNSGNLLKRDWNNWPEDSTTRTTCLSSFPTYNCLPFTPYDSMASVSKLVLVPIDMWHRLSKDRKDIDIHSIKTVDIPSSANQSSSTEGSANAPPLPDPPALLEGPVVVGASSLSPPSLPPSPPQKEKGRRRRGEPMYIDREDMGKEKTPSEIERNASM